VEDFGGRDKNEILDDIGADRGGRDVRRERAEERRGAPPQKSGYKFGQEVSDLKLV